MTMARGGDLAGSGSCEEDADVTTTRAAASASSAGAADGADTADAAGPAGPASWPALFASTRH